MRVAGSWGKAQSRRLLVLACVIVLSGCSTAPPPARSPGERSASPFGIEATASPDVATGVSATPGHGTAAVDNTLNVAVQLAGGFGILDYQNLDLDDEVILQRLVMSSLYRRDDRLRPVPDLAADMCGVDESGTRVTCRLREAWFHDGSPVTADDVAFSFLAISDYPALARMESATALDERTVQFTLSSPDVTFQDDRLGAVPIASKALYENAFEELVQAATALPADAISVLDSVDERRDDAQGDEELCAALQTELDDLRASAPDLIPDSRIRDWFPQSVHRSQCFRILVLVDLLRQATMAREAANVDDALPQAYRAVLMYAPRIGSGPFRVADHQPGVRTVFVAHDRYHHGRPAIDTVVAHVMHGEEATEALRRGEIDMIRMSFGMDDRERYETLRDEPRLRIATTAAPLYAALQFNVRAGRLFHDRDLRRALQLCLDKPALVDAATAGQGESLEGPLLPVHWAYQPDLRSPERDVAAARRLIEGDGWTLGADDVYQKAGRRLEAELLVRADGPWPGDRVRFAELVASRATDCGMALTARPLEFDALIDMLDTPPHLVPGGEEPFDLYLGGWGIGFEPHAAIELFMSDRIPTEPGAIDDDMLNYIGYSNPEFDRLAEAARTSSDMRERARLYRELQLILAADLPYLFGWTFTGRSYFTSDLVSSGQALNLESLYWDWELEKLTLEKRP